MIQFTCPCSACHEQVSPIPPVCWLCGTRTMKPYAVRDTSRPIGEVVEPIVDEIMVRTRTTKRRV